MPPKRAPAQAKKSPSAVAAGAAGKRKKLSFDESTLKAASSAVQTTHIGTAAAAKPAGKPQPKQQSKKGQSKPAPKAAAAAAKKHAVADRKESGIVKAKQTSKRAAAAAAAAAEEEEKDATALGHSEDDEDMSSNDEAELVNGVEDNLSDLADRSSSDDDEEEGAAAKRKAAAGSKKKNGVVAPYRAVRLSFLPAEFQEPQLYKFLNQFGATVLNCFCVRSKRTHRSQGIAYVEFDKESVIPLVVEECNGMALGGMSVRARPVTMHRPMPSRKMVTRRRALAYAYRTKGAPLKRHDVSRKSAVALLIKAARSEKVNNAHLKALGVDYQSDFFQSQLKAIPPQLLKKKVKTGKKAERAQKRAAARAAGTPKKDVPKAAPKAAAKKAPAPAPKKVAAPKKAAPKKK